MKKVTLVFAILGSVASASAGVVAYEPFQTEAAGNAAAGIYQDGSFVRGNAVGNVQHNVNGGPIVGFTGQNYSTTNTSLFDTEISSGLTAPSATYATGGGLRFEGWSDGNSRRLRRSLSAPLSSNTGDTYFFSSLIQPEEIDPNGLAMTGFMSAHYSQGLNINEPNIFGYAWGMNDGELVLRHRTNVNTMEDLVLDGNPVAGQTYHIVTKVEVNADATPGGPNDTVSVWVNPSPFADELNSPPNFIFDDFSMFGGNTGGVSSLVDRVGYLSEGYGTAQRSGGIIFDELRIGTTFEDVVTFIPEPSRAILLALGLVAVGFRRRRP